MGIGIIFADIVAVLFNWLMGSKLLEPDLKVVVKAGFIIVDENRSGNMHGIDQHQSLFDPALFETGFNFWGDIDKCSSSRHLKPQFFSVTLHYFFFSPEDWDSTS